MPDIITSVEYEAVPMVPLSVFTDELSYEFSDLTEAAMPHYILKAINRMARAGNILRRTATICTQDCVDNYLLQPPDCANIVAVMGICNICGSLCGDVTRLTHQPCHLSCGSASWFESPNIIYISPGRTGNAYQVKFAVAPHRDACEVDSILYDSYYDTVIDGVKYYLYSMTHKPWSSAARANEAKMDFERGIRAAAVDTLMGGQRGMMRRKLPKIV